MLSVFCQPKLLAFYANVW